MFDSHVAPCPNWGIRPILFTYSNFQVPSYAAFVLLGLLAGLVVYYIIAKKDHVFNNNSSVILASGLISGILGAKIPEWIVNFDVIIASLPDITPLLTGRTIVGGLLGGTIGVLITKRILGIHERRGNQFAPGIALGISIGRIGCFLAGCCYGIPTDLFCGVDFGDGIPRHPTQLYESIYALGLFFYLTAVRKKIHKPGILFDQLISLYLFFRFFIEFIRVEPIILWGLTGYQLACIAGIAYANRNHLVTFSRKKHTCQSE